MGARGSKEDDRDAVGLSAGGLDFDSQASQAASMVSASAMPSSQVQLSISCAGLVNMDQGSLSDPFVVLKRKEPRGGAWVEVARTEIVANNLNPAWAKLITVDYMFEEVQYLRFEVYDADTDFSSNDASALKLEEQDEQGVAECALALIVGGVNSTWSAPLAPSKPRAVPAAGLGSITVRAEEVPDANVVVTLEVAARDLPSPSKRFLLPPVANPFVRVSRLTEGGSATPCYRTEVKMGTSSPSFAPIVAPLAVLAAGDQHRPLLLEVWSWSRKGAHTLLCSTRASIEDLKGKVGKTIALTASGGVACGELTVRKCYTESKASFFDYLKGGMELQFMCAIDFTGSNGDPASRESLHYVDPTGQKLNEYAQAIGQIGSILEFYDTDKRFPLYGFGGKPQRGAAVSHCFAVNGNEADPEVTGVTGILQAYYQSLRVVELFGPTLFAPVINQAAAMAASLVTPDPRRDVKYSILLILTDGIINDMANTTDAIVAAAELPFSIIIVGVGNADFASMVELDGDDVRLTNSSGKKAVRDIVQFVPMREVSAKGPQALAKEVLSEIPSAVVEYCRMKRIEPAHLGAEGAAADVRDTLRQQHSSFMQWQQAAGASGSASETRPPATASAPSVRR